MNLMGDNLLTGSCELTLAVTAVMEAGLEGNRGSIDEGHAVAARVDVLADETDLGIGLHLRNIGLATKDVGDAHDNSILRHC